MPALRVMSGGTSHRHGWEIDVGSFALQTCCFSEILRTLTSLSLGADQQTSRPAEPQVIRFAGGWIDTSSVTTEAKG